MLKSDFFNQRMKLIAPKAKIFQSVKVGYHHPSMKPFSPREVVFPRRPFFPPCCSAPAAVVG
jgi:hypothetical protein